MCGPVNCLLQAFEIMHMLHQGYLTSPVAVLVFDSVSYNV